MKSSLVAGLALTGLIGTLASTTVAADARVFRAVDAATGARVAVTRDGDRIAISIEHPTVTIRKELRDGRTITTMKTPDDDVAVTFSRTAFVVSGRRGRVESGAAHPERVAAAQALLAASSAARRAEALIARMTVAPQSPLRHTLHSTRALLLAAMGGNVKREMAGPLQELRRANAATVRPVGQTEGPSMCWALYAAEAIATYMEYEDCMGDEQWWDLFGQIGCAVIYEIRAIGAFAWWLNCVGLRG